MEMVLLLKCISIDFTIKYILTDFTKNVLVMILQKMYLK